MKTPKAKQKTHIIEQHGIKRDDPFAWLRDENWQKITQGDLSFKNLDILSYIEEENHYTEQKLEKTHPDQKQKLYDEILSRIKEDYEAYPIKKGNFLYYHKMSKGNDYPTLCRKENIDSQEHVYFDVNKEAKDHDVFFLRKHETNDDETHLAYMVNTTGSMECTLKIRNLETEKDLDLQRTGLNGSFEWISATQLVYIKRDETSRGKYLYLLDMNSPDADRLIFEKGDELDHMFMGVDKSSDKEYLILSMESGASCAVFSAKIKDLHFSKIAQGDDDISYDYDHFENCSYLLTNKKAPKFKLLIKKDDALEWTEFIHEDVNFYLEDFHLYSHYLLLDRRNLRTGISELKIIDIQNPQRSIKVDFKEEAYTFDIVGSYDPYDTKIRISYESPVSPEQDLELDIESGELKTLKKYEVPNYVSSSYVVKREFAKARDGVLIPVTIIHHKNFKKGSQAPAYVYAYGSYGMGLEPDFSSSIFSLIDRGFCAVTAHVRGGDDLGHEWYLDGKLQKKKNTFHDYIDVCEYLIQENYTALGEIVGHGGSAGGLLTGVVANLRPDLFKALVCEVPFVDLVNTISDPTLPLTPPEWEEWGNPIENKDDFNYMMSYSPYDQIQRQTYPSLLYLSGISDEQVTYWEPLKMVAKLRENHTGKSPIYLKIKMGAGHAGASKRYEWIDDLSLIYHFIIDSFDHNPKRAYTRHMEHVLLSRILEQEEKFAAAAINSGKKVILRSCEALHRYLEIKDCATAIIDETILNQKNEQPATVFYEIYQAILRNNPKCLVLFLYQEESGLTARLKKKSHYTIFLNRESFTIQKLNYIFTVHQHQDYRSLFTKDLRAKTMAPIDLHIFHPLNQNYPLFIPEGTEIKKEILERLERDNVSQLFIKTGEFSVFLKMSQKIYHLFYSEEMHHIRKRYKYFLSDIVDDAEKGEWGKGRHLFDELTLLYSKISNLIAKSSPEQALKSLIFLRPNPIAQGLNSGIYAIVFSRILGLREEKELFYSALLYGLGKSEVPPRHLVKTSLDNTDLSLRSSYLRYVESSIRLIKKRKISVSPQVIENIESHKEHFDGSGYPRGLTNDEIPRNAQILGIIESFSNLYTFRQNEKFLNFRRAWSTLRENSQNAIIGAKHSPRILDELESRLSKKGIL